jgi:hypothetical protein
LEGEEGEHGEGEENTEGGDEELIIKERKRKKLSRL